MTDVRFARPGLLRPPAGSAIIVAAGGVLAVLTAGAALAAWVALSRSEHTFTAPVVRPSWLPAVELVVAVCAAVTVAVSARRDVVLGSALMLAAVLLPTWASWPIASPAGRAALLAAPPLAMAGAALIAAIPSRTVVALAVSACVTLVVGYDPFADPVCWETCEHASPLLARWLSTHQASVLAAGLVVAAGVVAVEPVVRRRTTAAPPVAGATVAAFSLVAASAVLRLTHWQGVSAPTAERGLPAIALVLASTAVAVTELRRRRTLRAVRRLADALATPDAALRAAVTGVAAVDFAVPGTDDWVDATGRRVTRAVADSLTLTDGSEPVARVHLSTHADRDTVVAALTPSARLALRNAQLVAAGRAQLAEVRESRRRLVQASDAERRRIERDLHDGAQQRLVSATLHLQVALPRVPPQHADRLRHAEDTVRETLARLRRLTHGVFPAALGDEGLAAALEELAATAAVPVSLDVALDTDLDLDVAMAAYAAVAAAFACGAPTATGAPDEHTPASSVLGAVQVDVHRRRQDVMVCVTVPAAKVRDVEEALIDAADRVGALGGSLAVMADDGDVRVEAVIPCASS